jgi:hypothetical protein
MMEASIERRGQLVDHAISMVMCPTSSWFSKSPSTRRMHWTSMTGLYHNLGTRKRSAQTITLCYKPLSCFIVILMLCSGGYGYVDRLAMDFTNENMMESLDIEHVVCYSGDQAHLLMWTNCSCCISLWLWQYFTIFWNVYYLCILCPEWKLITISLTNPDP